MMIVKNNIVALFNYAFNQWSFKVPVPVKAELVGDDMSITLRVAGKNDYEVGCYIEKHEVKALYINHFRTLKARVSDDDAVVVWIMDCIDNFNDGIYIESDDPFKLDNTIFSCNEFLRTFPISMESGKSFTRPRAYMNDGFSISIQASTYTYCFPRFNDLDEYKSVELGFPSCEDELINEYAEDPRFYTNTVYGYVPVEVVDELIKKHGGIVKVMSLCSIA